jgi:ABC-type transport system involved in cytochrome bd biosynthesis fused ATPase/permease subunit
VTSSIPVGPSFLGRHPRLLFGQQLWRSSPCLLPWWCLLAGARALLPGLLFVTMGETVGAAMGRGSAAHPLTFTAVCFVTIQVFAPLHAAMSQNLGERLARFLHARLMVASVGPPGVGHLEDPGVTATLALARDFDLALSGPPMSVSIGFIAAGAVEILTGVVQAALVASYRPWAAMVLIGAWGSTHWLLRPAATLPDSVSEDVTLREREADYAYRIAVDSPAAKEVRLYGLSDWGVGIFRQKRKSLLEARWHAMRLRQRPRRWVVLLVAVTLANGAVLWSIGSDAAAGHLTLARLTTLSLAVIGVSSVAFGSFNWALAFAARGAGLVERVEADMAATGGLRPGPALVPRPPQREIRFVGVGFSYPSTPDSEGRKPILDGFDLSIPAGTSLAVVGSNGAGKTTIAKLLCRMYDPDRGVIEVDGVPLTRLDVIEWRRNVTAVFQDFLRLDLPLRDNVAPLGAPEKVVRGVLDAAGLDHIDLDIVLSTRYPGGTDLSGGQWQRVALARALCAVRLGARVVILDEPTAHLDLRGELDVFSRLLAEARGCTTIVISHRFPTVRHAQRIVVVERGQVLESGNHDELMAAPSRYRSMFNAQAAGFGV